MNITIEAANSSEGATTGGSNGATGATGATGGGTTGGSITSSFLPTTLSQPPEMVPRKEITTDELEIVGYVLWAIIVLTLIGNFCSFYPVLHRSNFKKIMSFENTFLMSNVLCVALSFMDLCLVVLLGIPAALAFTNNDDLSRSFYNLAITDPVRDLIVWTQLLLVVGICLDRAIHISRPLTYHLKPYMLVLYLGVPVAIPFLTLTTPYILAAQASIESALAKEHVFICSYAAVMNETTGEVIRSRHIFMGCTLELNSDDWKYTKLYTTWENVGNLLILLLAVVALIGTNSVIVWMLVKSARFQRNSPDRQEQVAKSIRKTCVVSSIQAILLLASILPMRWYQIRDRNAVTATNPYFKTIAGTVLIFIAPIFNPWLYSIRMGNVRNFLAKRFRKSAGLVRTVIQTGWLGKSRDATSEMSESTRKVTLTSNVMMSRTSHSQAPANLGDVTKSLLSKPADRASKDLEKLEE